MLAYLRTELDRQGLSDVGLSTSGETSYDLARTTLNNFDAAALTVLRQVNVHGYQGTGSRHNLLLLDGAVEGDAYKYTFPADGGTSPFRWSASGLPDGLELTPDGTLAGRPKAGTTTFTVTMTDSEGATARQRVQLVVRASDTLLWRILGWLKRIVTWAGYLLLAAFVGYALWDDLGGHTDIVIPGKDGRLKRRKQARGLGA